MSDSNIDKAALLACMVEFARVDRPQPGDVTVEEFELASGLGRDMAARQLKRMVKAGMLTEHSVLLDTGRRGFVYRSVKRAA
jgi:predicted transcriptional regulator